MRKFILFCLLFLSVIASKAQFGGELSIGARLNYVGGGRIINADGERERLGYTVGGVISPGYFICNSFALGANLGYEYMKDKLGRQYTLSAYPFVRYYTPHGDLRFFMQLESGCGWGESFMKAGHDGRHRLWVSTLKPGLFIRIKDAMAVEVTVMSLEYKRVYMTDKGSNWRVTSDKWRYNWLDVSFGINLMIGL